MFDFQIHVSLIYEVRNSQLFTDDVRGNTFLAFSSLMSSEGGNLKSKTPGMEI